MSKVDTPCVIYPGTKNWKGYGRQSRGGKPHGAHRLAYEDAYGPIPEGKEIHHVCEVKGCVNPEHLMAVTRSEHRKLHGVKPPFSPSALKTHCPQGHPYDDENTGHCNGRRICRACHRDRARAHSEATRVVHNRTCRACGAPFQTTDARKVFCVQKCKKAPVVA